MNVDMLDVLEPLTALIRAHLAAESRAPVRAPRTPAALHAALDLTLSETGRPLDEVVALLHEILAVTPSTASHSFFNQLFAGRDGAAVLGDALASVLNSSMYTYKVAGVHVLLEQLLVARMGRMVGFDNPDGIFTPGGSLSNLCGMLIARNEAVPTAREEGLGLQRLRVYSSEEAHYSVRKSAGLLGIGRGNIVDIPADRRGRMRPEALSRAIAADRAAGHLPVMINATAGTTVLGAFDPLDAIADVAQEHGVWMHTDAAYGGSMLFHPGYAEHLRGIARSDSVVWDAHKLMGVPLVCSVILTRQPDMLRKHLNEAATYLFQDHSDDHNPGTRSLQCGRRNDALKLWTAWKTHGDVGYRARMVRLRELTLRARAMVVAHPRLSLVREPESLNLCFTVQGAPADQLCSALNEQERLMLGYAIVDGALVVRMVLLNPLIDEGDLDAFFAHVLAAADSLHEA